MADVFSKDVSGKQDYASIERWWEIVLSTYLLVTWYANDFQHQAQTRTAQPSNYSTSTTPFEHHVRWESGTTWKSALNNLRLLIQPFIYWCLLEPWLRVFSIPGFKRCFFKLIAIMNDFRASPIVYAQAS